MQLITSFHAIVGLPARGKSTIAQRLSSYLNWLHIDTRVFNVGSFRRQQLVEEQQAAMEAAKAAKAAAIAAAAAGQATQSDGQGERHEHSFFSPDNEEAVKVRETMAFTVLDQALTWLEQREGEQAVAIFDATNTTLERRAAVAERVRAAGMRVLAVESECNNDQVLDSNFRQKIANSPDYKGLPLSKAFEDLYRRIENYKRVYVPLNDEEGIPYIKLIDLNQKVIAFHVFGSLLRRILFFSMNIHISHRPIWLCRAGHSDELSAAGTFLKHGQPGHRRAETTLSRRGRAFARWVASFTESHQPPSRLDTWYERGSLTVITSNVQRAIDTAANIECDRREVWSALQFRNRGIIDGLTKQEIIDQYPHVYEGLQNDPFNFRIPGGESVADVVRRLDPVVNEIERQKRPIFVVSHLSTLQVLYAYYSNTPVELCHTIDIPQDTIIELTSTQYGWIEKRFRLADNPLLSSM